MPAIMGFMPATMGFMPAMAGFAAAAPELPPARLICAERQHVSAACTLPAEALATTLPSEHVHQVRLLLDPVDAVCKAVRLSTLVGCKTCRQIYFGHAFGLPACTQCHSD